MQVRTYVDTRVHARLTCAEQQACEHAMKVSSLSLCVHVQIYLVWIIKPEGMQSMLCIGLCMLVQCRYFESGHAEIWA